MDYYRFTVRLGLAALVATTPFGCAQERDPINKVQANALAKSFFVGASLSDTSDDPEFYASTDRRRRPVRRPSVGLHGCDRCARSRQMGDLREGPQRASDLRDDQQGRRQRKPRDQQRRGDRLYSTSRATSTSSTTTTRRPAKSSTSSSRTGDRPWYAREYMRVDWSSNHIVSAYSFDHWLRSSSMTRARVARLPRRRPQGPRRAGVRPREGYFDVTNKIYIKPHTLSGLRVLTITRRLSSAARLRAGRALGRGQAPSTRSGASLSAGEKGFRDYLRKNGTARVSTLTERSPSIDSVTTGTTASSTASGTV